VATARMTHLCVENSILIGGATFGNHPLVESLIANPSNYCVALFPGVQALNLSHLPRESVRDAFPHDRQLVIFVIDGTWHNAKKMLARSPNLARLPRICFTPEREYQY